MIIAWFYLLIPLLFLAWFYWRKPDLAVTLTAVLSPTYLIKSSIGFIPTTFLELAIYTLVLVELIKFLLNKRFSIQEVIVKFKPLGWPVAAWFMVALLAVLISPDLRLSLGILKGWFVDPILFLLLLLINIKIATDWLKVIIGLFVGVSFVSSYGLLEYSLGWGLRNDGLLNSVYESANYVAMFIVPILFFGTTLALVVRGRKIRYLYWLLLLVNILALYYTKSYGGYLALLVGLVFYLIMYSRQNIKMRKLLLLSGVALVLLSGVIVSSQDKFQNYLKGGDRTSISTRQQIWQTSVLLIKEKSILGWGLGNFQESYRSRVKQLYPKPLEWNVVKAHNLYLNLWIEMGILGLLVFLYLIIKIFFILKSELKTEIKERKMFIISLLSAVVAILVHGLVDTPYFKNDLSLVFFIFVGLILLLKNHPDWQLEVNYKKELT